LREGWAYEGWAYEGSACEGKCEGQCKNQKKSFHDVYSLTLDLKSGRLNRFCVDQVPGTPEPIAG
jgi:hypothetical protein